MVRGKVTFTRGYKRRNISVVLQAFRASDTGWIQSVKHNTDGEMLRVQLDQFDKDDAGVAEQG